MQSRRSRAWAVIAAGSMLACAGCTSGITHDDATATLLSKCGTPMKGAKYELCGHWSTSGFAVVGGPGVSAIGSVDSAPQTTGATYQVKGGTFHGAR